MSNLTGVTRDMYPEDVVARADGLFGPEGEIVLAVPITEAEVHWFNGTSPTPPPAAKSETKPTKKPAKKKTKAKKK